MREEAERGSGVAGVRLPPTVLFCTHASIAAEACAPAGRSADHVTCGGVWGTGTIPQRGARGAEPARIGTNHEKERSFG